MAATRNITQQIRFLITAVTVLCVLLLNNQEITTYKAVNAKSNSGAHSHLKNASQKEKTVVKQKVSFEATPTYFVFQLVHFTKWLLPEFLNPLSKSPDQLPQPSYLIYFFSVLFGSIIIPNAP